MPENQFIYMVQGQWFLTLQAIVIECLLKDSVKILYINKSINAEWVEKSPPRPLLFCIALSGKYAEKRRLLTVHFLGQLKLFGIFYVPNTLRLYSEQTNQLTPYIFRYLWVVMSVIMD